MEYLGGGSALDLVSIFIIQPWKLHFTWIQCWFLATISTPHTELPCLLTYSNSCEQVACENEYLLSIIRNQSWGGVPVIPQFLCVCITFMPGSNCTLPASQLLTDPDTILKLLVTCMVCIRNLAVQPYAVIQSKLIDFAARKLIWLCQCLQVIFTCLLYHFSLSTA